jgi:hypothetical protein
MLMNYSGLLVTAISARASRGLKWLKRVVARTTSSYKLTLHFEFCILNFVLHSNNFAGLTGKSVQKKVFKVLLKRSLLQCAALFYYGYHESAAALTK